MPQFELQLASQHYPLSIPGHLLIEGEDFFSTLERDMARGWQMGRVWVAQPNLHQRCQIIAQRLTGALERGQTPLAQLLSAYLLSRLPQLARVEIDPAGEIQDIQLTLHEAHPGLMPIPTARPTTALSKLEALQRASQEISKVYRVGKHYRYAAYDATSQRWCESGSYASQAEAEQQRMVTYRERFERLILPQ